jgi:hypothetical protein
LQYKQPLSFGSRGGYECEADTNYDTFLARLHNLTYHDFNTKVVDFARSFCGFSTISAIESLGRA